MQFPCHNAGGSVRFLYSPTLFIVFMAQSLPVFSQIHCHNVSLIGTFVNWKTPKSPSPRLEIRQMTLPCHNKRLCQRDNLRSTIKIGYRLMISCLSIRPTLKAHHGTNPTEARLSRVQPLKPCRHIPICIHPLYLWYFI